MWGTRGIDSIRVAGLTNRVTCSLFDEEVNPSLAKPQLKFYGGLAKLNFVSKIGYSDFLNIFY